MSLDNIQLLDTSVIHQLRSSLVISSLTQCLKELIYNALDANATCVDILLSTEKFTLQVNDNGYGIPNLSKIGQRHVTSKCHSLSDMNQLKTFGFRGEALAAITNESFTQIISRHYLSKETYEGFWKDGTIIGEISPARHTKKAHPGTSVIVRDLFYKFPVRRKQTATAYQHVVIIESVKRLIMTFALVFHYVSFTLVDSDRNTKILIVRKANTSLDTFRQLFGYDLTKHVKSSSMHEDAIKIDGFFSTISYPNKAHQYIYMNNYYLPPDNVLYKIVSDMFLASTFSDTADKDRITTRKGKGRFIQKHPIFLIKFICPNWSSYDINMYLEMLTEFASFHAMESMLKRFTAAFLRLSGFLSKDKEPSSSKKTKSAASSSNISKCSPYLAHTPSVLSSSTTGYTQYIATRHSDNSAASSLPRPDEEEDESYITWWDPNKQKMLYIDKRTGNSYLSPPETQSSDMQMRAQHQYQHHENTIDRSHLKRAYSSLCSDSGPSVDPASELDSSKRKKQQQQHFPDLSLEIPNKLTRSDFEHAKVLGQVDKKYIAIKLLHNNNLIMIDQHAADERIKLEVMLKNITSIAMLEPPITIDLDSASEFQLVTSERISKYLKIWGIHITTTMMNRVINRHTEQEEAILSQSRYFNTEETSSHFENDSSKNRVYVTRLPNLIVDRCIVNHDLLKALIRDHVYWMAEQKEESALIKTCPKGIMEMLKSKACRSAIMFNDELSLNQCETIVRELAKCNFPFQCAHGRPSAVPINLRVNSPMYRASHNRPTNWEKFKKD